MEPSLTANTGIKLLSPGETPYENAQFLLFLYAIIKAVDDYQNPRLSRAENCRTTAWKVVDENLMSDLRLGKVKIAMAYLSL